MTDTYILMRKAAFAFYRRSDPNQQKTAKQFFNKMDTDRNGKISPNEFLEALKQVDYDQSKQNELAELFKKLDTNFDENLDFFEALPFYYLIRHKTALFCSGCSVLLVGKYFSCLDCHVKGGNSYDLCIVCYQKGKFNDHIHKSLYDNTHLLQLYRNLVAYQNANRKGGSSTGSAGLSFGPNVIKQKGKIICARCFIQLGSIYFSCLECHMQGRDTYDLCIDCYGGGASNYHMHKSLFENNVLLQIYRLVVAKWKENKEGTHVTSHVIETVVGIGLDVGVGTVRVVKLASHIGSSTSGTGQYGYALGTGSADPSLLMATGDVGTAGSNLAQCGSSLPDVADQGTSLADFADQSSSLADFAQQDWSLSDIADQGSSLADFADQGSSLADIAQQGWNLADIADQGSSLADFVDQGSSFANAAQNVSDLVDVATTISSACSIM